MRAAATGSRPAVIWYVRYCIGREPGKLTCVRQSNPIVKAAQEAAFKESVEWLIQYL